MTTWILKAIDHGKKSWYQDIALSRYQVAVLLMLALLAVLGQYNGELANVIVLTLSDAYLAVSIFVALTLAGFYFLDNYFKADIARLLNQRSPLQVPMASFLGALPGCGGAIIVVTQFVHGQMSFGALVAVLISTMGDAAFLLLSKKPDVALAIYAVSILAGTLFGYLINHIHGYDYMKLSSDRTIEDSVEVSRLPGMGIKLFIALLVPSSVLGFLDAFQLFDTDILFGSLAFLEPTKWIGFAGAIMCIAIWLSQPLNSWSARFAKKSEVHHVKETVVAETSFVSVWVIAGFLCYELLVHFTGLDLKSLFIQLGVLAPMLAILIGFIPGCGPQIIITTLYINGVVPLSSQLANAISNDGDALFPAIAMAPRAAIKATLYSSIPAFILGYGAFLLGW